MTKCLWMRFSGLDLCKFCSLFAGEQSNQLPGKPPLRPYTSIELKKTYSNILWWLVIHYLHFPFSLSFLEYRNAGWRFACARKRFLLTYIPFRQRTLCFRIVSCWALTRLADFEITSHFALSCAFLIWSNLP